MMPWSNDWSDVAPKRFSTKIRPDRTGKADQFGEMGVEAQGDAGHVSMVA